MDRLDASIKSYPHAEGIEAIMTQTDMTPLQRLAKVLQLGTPSNYRNHTYINGESLYFPTGRVYGGQVIAQSLMAASRTVAPSRLPNSIHGYFISAGDIRQDLLFDVENLRDGRSFSARRVRKSTSMVRCVCSTIRRMWNWITELSVSTSKSWANS